MLLTGVTVDNTLDGIKARPELYPQTSKKVPDVNFYYRYLCYFKYLFLFQVKKMQHCYFC